MWSRRHIDTITLSFDWICDTPKRDSTVELRPRLASGDRPTDGAVSKKDPTTRGSFMRKSLLAPVAAGALLVVAGTAQAFTRTTTFQVTANVANNCSMSAASMNLGTFNGVGDLTSSSSITVNCTNLLPYTVDLSAGSGTYA